MTSQILLSLAEHEIFANSYWVRESQNEYFYEDFYVGLLYTTKAKVEYVHVEVGGWIAENVHLETVVVG